jgi:hypothetical protein
LSSGAATWGDILPLFISSGVGFVALAALVIQEIQMSKLADAVTALQTAVAANTDATNKAVAALGTNPEVDQAADAVTAATTQVTANTAALTGATGP